MYTQTGYDASAHMAEETQGADKAAAKGVWRSVFFSALIGWLVLLAFLFAATDVGAVNDAGAGARSRCSPAPNEPELGGGGDPDRERRPDLLRRPV